MSGMGAAGLGGGGGWGGTTWTLLPPPRGSSEGDAVSVEVKQNDVQSHPAHSEPREEI